MSGLLKLRDYQRATIDALQRDWDAGQRRIAAVLPTGAGKTVVFSHLVAQWLKLNPGKRVLILAHTDELVLQAAKKLADVAPGLKIGIVKAARNDVSADVIVASVQTLRGARRRAQLRRVGLIVVDECHHATAKTYRTILEHFGALAGSMTARWEGKDSAIVAGFTATLARGDNAKLSEIWQGVSYRKDIGFMIRRGYLRDVTGKRVEVADLELDKVRRSGGDFQAADLGEKLEASLAPEIVAKAYVEHASDRSGVLFAPTVSAAYAFADALNTEGVKTEVVHGELGTEERRAILARLADGTTQVVSNCMVLTEGFDSPRVSCVVVARPTKSKPLYQQMVGRGLRPMPGTPAVALILDVVGASRTHNLASLVDLSEKDLAEIPPDGMTLTELEDLEEIEECGLDPIKLVHDGPVETVDFDPLNRDTKSAWGQTKCGIWFLSVGAAEGRYVFLLPSTLPGAEPDTYDVIWASKSAYGRDREHGATEHRGVSLEAAFAWAEDVAEDWKMNANYGVNTTDKKAAWRRGEATLKQIDMLRRFKLLTPELKEWLADDTRERCPMTKGEAAVLLDKHFASDRIDPIAAWAASYKAK